MGLCAITAMKGVDLLQLPLTGTDSLQEGMYRSLEPMSKFQYFWLGSRKSSPTVVWHQLLDPQLSPWCMLTNSMYVHDFDGRAGHFVLSYH